MYQNHLLTVRLSGLKKEFTTGSQPELESVFDDFTGKQIMKRWFSGKSKFFHIRFWSCVFVKNLNIFNKHGISLMIPVPEFL